MGGKNLTETVLIQDEGSFLVSLSVASVVFSFHEESIKVLLLNLNNKDEDTWILPGGFIHQDENVDDTVRKIVEASVGVEDFYLEQFHLFGEYDRLDFANHHDFFTNLSPHNDFNTQDTITPRRLVCMGYYALVRYDDVVIPNNDPNIANYEWFNIDEIPSQLYFDHDKMIKKAIISIRQRIGYVPIGYSLLPEKFTMPEIRIAYEAFLGKELDRRNFQRKMLSIGLINKLDEKKKKGAHKSPYLYSFNIEKYKKAVLEGEQLMAWNIH